MEFRSLLSDFARFFCWHMAFSSLVAQIAVRSCKKNRKHRQRYLMNGFDVEFVGDGWLADCSVICLFPINSVNK